MQKLAVVIISLAGLTLSPLSALAEDTTPTKTKATKTVKKKPSAKKSKPAKATATTAASAGAAAVAATPAAPAVDAVAAQVLATKHACMTCHKVDAKLLGPGFKEVAAKYKGDKTAEANLVSKVKQGGSGAWGSIPMPPHPQVPDAEIKTVVQWVLSLK